MPARRDDSPTSRRPPPASKKNSNLSSYANSGLNRRLQDGYTRLVAAVGNNQKNGPIRKGARAAAMALGEDLLMSVNPSMKRGLVDPLQMVCDDPFNQAPAAQMCVLEIIGILVQNDRLHLINRGVPELMRMVCGCFDISNPNEDTAPIIAAIVGKLAASQSHEVHGKVTTMTMRTCFNMAILCRTPKARQAATEAMGHALRSMMGKAEGALAAQPSNLNSTGAEVDNIRANVMTTDVLTMLQQLCKIASQKVPSTANASANEARMNALALDLIEQVFESAGPMLRGSHAFGVSVLERLVPVFEANASHWLPNIFKETTETFLQVFLHHRALMAENLGVLFALVYLPLARSSESGFLHKQTCLNLFRRAFEGRGTGRIVLELYINYDCNRRMPNLTELCVSTSCEVIVATHAKPGWISSREEGALHCMGLDIQLSLLTSMLNWATNQTRKDHGTIDCSEFLESKKEKGHLIDLKSPLALSRTCAPQSV